MTLTANPTLRAELEFRAIQHANKRSVNWHELPAADRQKRLFRAFYGEVQKYLKRVREKLRVQGKRRLRFFAVCEAHKDGFPHAHLLIHEESFADANERLLRLEWRHNGYAIARVVRGSAHAAIYVTKYLTKRSLIVRASQLYGRSEPKAFFLPSEACAPGPSLDTGKDTSFSPSHREGVQGVGKGSE